MTCYQCEDCRRFYRADTGPICCPRCGSKERELFPLADAIYDAVMACPHFTTGRAVELFATGSMPANKQLHDRIEARLNDLDL